MAPFFWFEQKWNFFLRLSHLYCILFVSCIKNSVRKLFFRSDLPFSLGSWCRLMMQNWLGDWLINVCVFGFFQVGTTTIGSWTNKITTWCWMIHLEVWLWLKSLNPKIDVFICIARNLNSSSLEKVSQNQQLFWSIK